MLASPFEGGQDERAPMPIITLIPRDTGDQRESERIGRPKGILIWQGFTLCFGELADSGLAYSVHDRTS
jgi:hypothetical protein